MRGTRRPKKRGRTSQRIIPACAGNADERRTVTQPRSDHPRVCGERLDFMDANGWPLGSSPRVRGTPCNRACWPLCARIIPACAGNAQRHDIGDRHQPDHPRVCGERSVPYGASVARAGSSPRVRGTPLWPFARHRLARIIPACAGNALPVSDYFIT